MAAEAGLDDIVAALLIAGADPNSVHAVCYNIVKYCENIMLITALNLGQENCL